MMSDSQIENAVIVTWRKEFGTGIGYIDQQHRELIVLINRLYRACLGKTEVEAAFKDAMSRMVEYVRFHFTAELEVLRTIHYPDYQNHKKQHEQLIENILRAAKDYNEGKRLVPHNFVRTLADWVFGHIAVIDRLYANYVVEQKRKGFLSDQQLNELGL